MYIFTKVYIKFFFGAKNCYLTCPAAIGKNIECQRALFFWFDRFDWPSGGALFFLLNSNTMFSRHRQWLIHIMQNEKSLRACIYLRAYKCRYVLVRYNCLSFSFFISLSLSYSTGVKQLNSAVKSVTKSRVSHWWAPLAGRSLICNEPAPPVIILRLRDHAQI